MLCGCSHKNPERAQNVQFYFVFLLNNHLVQFWGRSAVTCLSLSLFPPPQGQLRRAELFEAGVLDGRRSDSWSLFSWLCVHGLDQPRSEQLPELCSRWRWRGAYPDTVKPVECLLLTPADCKLSLELLWFTVTKETEIHNIRVWSLPFQAGKRLWHSWFLKWRALSPSFCRVFSWFWCEALWDGLWFCVPGLQQPVPVMSLYHAKLGMLTSKLFFLPQLKVMGSCPFGSSCKVQILFLVVRQLKGLRGLAKCICVMLIHWTVVFWGN